MLRAAAAIFAVMDAVVLGLTTWSRIRSDKPLAGVRAFGRLPPVQHVDGAERKADHRERDGRDYGAERIDVGVGHGGGEALEIERQRVHRADRLAGTREFVPGQREAEQADT